MSYTPEFKESILHHLTLLKKQIDNSKKYIESKPYSETISAQEHLDNLMEKYEYVLETYPEMIV